MTLIASFLEIYYNCSDMYEQLNAIIFIGCVTLALLKILMIRIYADNFTHNFSSAVNDYLAIDCEKKRRIMRRHAFMGRIIYYNVMLFAIFSSIGLILAPIVTSYKNDQINVSVNNVAYPLPATCTLAHFRISTTLYLVIFVMQCIIIVITCAANIGNKIKKFFRYLHSLHVMVKRSFYFKHFIFFFDI